MNKIFLGLLLLLLGAGSLFAAEVNFTEFQQILDDKCSQCHTRLRIEDAIRQGADMDMIIDKMIRMGAQLNQHERQVMGVFWTQPGEQPQAIPENDPLREYRTVLETRCTGCHSLEIVEKAMRDGRSIDDLVELMRKRGAIIPAADKKVLGTFWGNPLKAETP